ncbi:MAG: LacI family DNA-binding transcriptional regulator [Anaerovoracaceae bacterium]
MNIREIAKEAGVSVATVSRVMNHPETVADKTRERIEKIIAEEEYTPNWFARSLNFDRTGTIGVTVPNLLDSVYMEIAKGVEDVAYQKGYTTFMCDTGSDRDKEKQYLEELLSRRADGIILISSVLEDEDFAIVREKKVPVVMIGGNKSNPGFSCVRIDCYQASKEATQHLINIGYKRIALICGNLDTFDNRDKIRGYRAAMEEAGLKIRDGYLKLIPENIENGYLTAKKLIERKNDRPEAIFATSDTVAMGVIDAAKDHKLKLPADLGVMGFDNIRVSNLVDPKLTTVEAPLHKMGVYGARLLFDDIEDDKEEVKDIILQTRLKIRKSCGHKERIGEMF